ncbi:SDR family NAD(P)-dependent oxidoreductase [Enterovirga rhinocerotis]|uniref:2-deoxy-D-gluconate 3-dehydrogenase n=1 Tax=Enterovirga rhinocerotis TaxID=1339210 RepID=A0A4R7C9B0_9HYPH|nr:glucose 1-dehydrogenase [Enterovirga rhinocerotis]TDR94622.1 2-deoxy-D-gluconate 3-dehydrogenase [Enterovirga rhinocerotis]
MKLFDLTGRVAIVTGGNGGIGLGMAKGLAEAGARVAITGRNAAKAEAALKELGPHAFFVEAEVSDRDACFAMVEEVARKAGRVDILIANAGIANRKRPEALTEEDWRGLLDINLSGAFFCCQAVYPHMQKAGGGKIVTIGSMLSLFGAPFGAAYGASKGGIMQLTKSLATAWAADGIQVNCVLPGWIDTDLAVGARAQVDGLNEHVLKRTPAKRWGRGDDLAGIAVFLASEASDYVTGTAIPVDGGYAAQS